MTFKTETKIVKRTVEQEELIRIMTCDFCSHKIEKYTDEDSFEFQEEFVTLSYSKGAGHLCLPCANKAGVLQILKDGIND